MATDWDPNTPGTIGLGWFPTEIGGTTSSQSRAVAMTVPSTATETIAAAYIGYHGCTSPGRWLCEVFTAGSEVPTGQAVATGYLPGPDEVNASNLWQTQAGATTNLFDSINNGVVNPAVYITYAGSFQQQTNVVAFNFDTSGWPTARRVFGLTFTFTANAESSAVGRMQVLYRATGGTNYTLGQVSLTNSVETFQFTLGEINPATGLPWTEAQIEALATTAGFGFRALSGASVQMRVYDANVSISYATENRLAVGEQETLTTLESPQWVPFLLQNPTSGAANWSKANATDYTVLVRPISTTGAIPGALTAGQGTIRTLDSGDPLPTGSVAYRPLIDSFGAVVDMGDEYTFGMSLALDVDASATDSADGMPYIRFPNVNSYAYEFDGRVVAQLITGATSSAPYELLRIVLGVAPATSLFVPDGTVDITVHRQSDNVQVGPTYSVTTADVRAAPSFTTASTALGDTEFHLLEIPVSFTLANATQYYVQVEAAGAVGASLFAMSVGSVSTSDQTSTANGNPATYGGTTDTLLVDPAGGGPPTIPQNDADALITLSTIPVPVENVSVHYENYDTANSGCNPTLIPTNVVEWAATTLGATFAYYQIERSTAVDVWDLVAQITSEDVEQYQDKEYPFGQDVGYRIRVVRAGDLIASDWTYTPAIRNDADCVYYLSSNLHELQFAYNAGDRTTWQFPSSDETALAPRSGSDYQQALINSEWRGDVFELDLTVWLPEKPEPLIGRAALDPVLELTRAPLPYVCVRDAQGSVWYANVNIAEGTYDHRSSVENDTVTAVVTELTDTPAVVDVTVDSDVLFLDLFNRADTADINGSLPNIGPAWITLSFTGGAIGIDDDRAYASTVDAAANVAYSDAGISDGWIESTLTYSPPGLGESIAPISWRGDLAAFDGWQVNLVNDGLNGLRLIVQRIDTGVPTIFYNQPNPLVDGDTYTFRAEFLDSYTRVMLDGTLLCEIINDTYSTNTQVSFGINSADNYLHRIEAGLWADGTTVLDVETTAAVWVDARSIDVSWVAADDWQNLGTLGAAQDATTAVGGPNDLTPTFVASGETAGATHGPGFLANDTAPIGSDARCFTIPYNPVQTIPEFSGGRTITFLATPSATFGDFNKMGWTYSGPALFPSENGWVVEDVPGVGPPDGPVIFGAASPGPEIAGVTYNHTIPGLQVWTVVADRATGTLDLYRNGALLSTEATTLAGLGDNDSGAEFEMGRNFLFAAFLLHGYPATEEDVLALHDSLLNGPDLPQREPTYTPFLWTP